MEIKLVFADHQPIVLAGLNAVFSAQPDCRVLASCTESEEALRVLRAQAPDVLIVDLQMPGQDAFQIVQAMSPEEKEKSRVVLYTARLSPAQTIEAIRLGVKGLVLKEMETQFLVQCVRRVHAGGEWLERRSANLALAQLASNGHRATQPLTVLSAREREVAGLVAEGLTNKEIARRLGLTEGTVKIHLHNIFEKVGVKSRVELAIHARRPDAQVVADNAPAP